MIRADRVNDGRQLLRAATHAEHVRLNQHPMLAGLTRSGYPLGRYRMLIVAYYHFYRAIEDSIEQFSGATFKYASRRKLPWLIDDLAYLGIDPGAVENLPQKSPHVEPPAGIAELVGILYTIEGSTLGGQVISRHLKNQQGLDQERGGRFFFAYGRLTEQRWQEFECFLNATLVTATNIERAVIAARSTFALIETILDDFHERVL